MGNGWLVLAGTAGMWATLRMRLPTGSWKRQLFWEAGIGLTFGLIMAVGIVGLGTLLGLVDAWEASNFHSSLVPALLMLGIGPGFLVSRGMVRVWLLWDRLRRQRMVWSLTHAHLVVVVIVMALWVVFLVILGPLQGMVIPDDQIEGFWSALVSNVFVTLFPAAMVGLLVTFVMLVVVLPPSALLSFLVARKTTRRLETLTSGTAALRDGAYGTRIAVEGEDEVAQLQSDFNAMAETLEATLRDLEAERDKVAHLLASRQTLIASVSHELRTPVATVRGYLDSMRRRDLTHETLEHDLDIMEREILRLQRLIDDLFTLSRAEVEALTLDVQPVEVGPLIERRLEALAPLAWERERIEMVAEVPRDAPPVFVDEGRLDQILTNLLRNAMRHTPPGGIIVVHVEAEKDRLRIQVCDTGEGIAPEDRPHIWERFYRGAEARTQDRQGAGLGLPLVKELTEAMGGAVGVISRAGEGSCFYITLPRYER
jgi:signal transduction histidine kinase